MYNKTGFNYVANYQAFICLLFMSFLCFLAGYNILYPSQEKINNEKNKIMDASKDAAPPKITELKPEYKNYSEIVDLLKLWEKDAKDFVEVGTYGKTTKGLDQYYVKITNKKIAHKKPSCVITGCIHGNEPISTCTEIWWMTHLLSSYQDNPKIKKILDSREIYFIPVLSPDTFPHSRHVDGVDPNRNFPSQGEKTSVTPIENFKNFFKEKKFDAFITGHSYGRIFLFAQDKDPERKKEYDRIKKEMDKISSYRSSYLGGPNTTLDGDWGSRQGAFSLLVEFGTHQRIPSKEDIQTDFDATYESFVYFLEEAPIAFIKNCGYADIEEKFELNCNFEDIINLIESKKEKIIEEINIKVLEDLGGGKFKLRRKNNIGEFVWISEEKIDKNSDSFNYSSHLLECLKGDIETMEINISIEKNGSKSLIKASLISEVEDISSKNLKLDMKMKCRRIKNFFIDELNLND